MYFNSLCSRNDMSYAYESNLIPESKLTLKAPKSSYIIASNINKDSKGILKIDFKTQKEASFDIKSIPNFISLSSYSIPIKNNKRLVTLHITNKSVSNILSERSAILYCHENLTDLIRLVPFLIDISLQLKVDIICFDYQGFGDTASKPKLNTIFTDGVEALNFVLTFLKYKIENISLFGKGIGAMCAIYLASLNDYHDCKSLVLMSPIIGNKTIDIKIMRSIICKCLLVLEIEDKDEIEDNEIVNLCREIENEKEWLPIKKKNGLINEKFKGFKNFMAELPCDDVYTRRRCKFIRKLRDYIYNEDGSGKNRKNRGSSMGESTDSQTYLNTSMNKNNNFDDVNDIKNKKEDIFNENEIRLKNDEDY